MDIQTKDTIQAERNQRRVDVLAWILQWGFTSLAILLLIAESKNRKYATNLIKQGLLEACVTDSCQPKTLFRITRAGYEFVIRNAPGLSWHPALAQYKPYEIRYTQVIHDLTCQYLTLRALRVQGICGFQPDRLIRQAQSSCEYQKQPDVVWILQNKAKVAIEYERTLKSGKKLENFIIGIFATLDSEIGNEFGRFQHYVIAVDSEFMAGHYRRAISSVSRHRLPFDLIPAGWHQMIEIRVLENQL